MGIVPLTGGDGDRVAGVEEEFLIPEAVFEATGEQVKDFVAVRMAVTRVGLPAGMMTRPKVIVVEFPNSREASQVSFPQGWSIKMPSAGVRTGVWFMG